MLRIVKTIGKNLLCILLEAQVRHLRKKHTFSIICVAGSVGKTSTKLAVAQMLGAQGRVRFQDGNYNDRLTVPLVVFGQSEPHIFNVSAWLRILWQNYRALGKKYPYKYVVLELGTDAPGQMAAFSYLRPDITVVTSVSPEHMEYFKTLDAVAAEELTVLHYSKQTLINIDDTPHKYLETASYAGYGFDADADYCITDRNAGSIRNGQTLAVQGGGKTQDITTNMLGEQGAKVTLAAVAVADMLGMSADAIADGAQNITAPAGRMQVLDGIKGVTIIDDTYNASPIAVNAALDVLYATTAPQRIAILGSMNEMGVLSPELHAEIGKYCNPNMLDLVVTIGKDANQFLAPAARAKGCNVEPFDHPLLAGRYVAERLKAGAIVLAKGSQNGVFAEEAIVPLLERPEDRQRLVRQSAGWQRKKQASLPSLTQ